MKSVQNSVCVKPKRCSSPRGRCARSLIPAARSSSLSSACPRVRLRDLYLALHGGSLGLPLIESVSQSVSLPERRGSYASHCTRSVHARTHAKDHLRAIIFLPSAALSIERVDNRALKSLEPGRGEGVGEDPLLRHRR